MKRPPAPVTTRIDILAEKGSEELLPEALYSSCNGIWVEEHDQGVLIHCYASSAAELLDHIRDTHLFIKEIEVLEEEEKDYAALTRKYFRPITVGDLTILPPWTRSGKDGLKIVIEPAMAFGTGRHESTKLMLKMMREIPLEEKSVIDVGSGSGILSIFAHLLGGRPVIAVDHDLDAARAVKKNCELNHISEIAVFCGDLRDLCGRFDVVLANLDYDTFKTNMNALPAMVEEGGYLVISGIEAQYKTRVPALFGTYRLVTQRKMNAWYGFVFKIDKPHAVQIS